MKNLNTNHNNETQNYTKESETVNVSEKTSADNVLKTALEAGTLDMDAGKDEIAKRNQILKEHEKDIWQGKTTKHWYVYLPDEKRGRIQKERRTKEEIEDIIVDFYGKDIKGVEDEEIEKLPDVSEEISPHTLEEIFPLWYEYKAATGAADAYIKKIYDLWKKYYEKDHMVKKDIALMDKVDYEMWAHGLVEKYNLNKKLYYNITGIIRQALDFAVEKGYAENNKFRGFNMPTRFFRRDKKKDDETQVFMTDEQPKVEKACWDKFNARPMFTSSLAILLHFRTGLRVGEMVALRESDIEGDYIHVQRQQVSAYELDKVNGELTPIYKGTKIVEHAKSAAGDRYVFLTPEAKDIIALIIDSNEYYGNKYEDYLFVRNGRIMKETTIIKKLYDICEMAGIPKKSTHKIRKTFVSTLIDADVNINTIRKTVGHEKESTTLSAYTYDRHTDDEVNKQLTDALDIKKTDESKS